ncbi:UNVERIFIED_CONTAM: hypothetical protein Sindi_1669500 [Sesamum indicum]
MLSTNGYPRSAKVVRHWDTRPKSVFSTKPKPANPPIAVYVPKVGTLQEPTMPEQSRNQPRKDGDTTYVPSRPTHMPDRNMNRPPSAPVVEKQREGSESPRDAAGPSREERAIWNVRGLNKRDHQVAIKDIVAEFRLQFLGLLETRVRINNVSHIQAFLLPQWQWFVDYGSSGNRIWIAWDENFIDVDVVECGTQFIHCHVNIRAIHESIAITVIYGANELVERRALWGSMETIAMQCTNILWLVGGDFNAVRDLSEICGVSGDIRMAMEDFNTCIQNTGLLPLPMQGEWYTWHNCSAGPRNLWKRLDRMLINDRWMDRFPTSYYSCLTPRTSDHSPMVLCGNRQQQLGDGAPADEEGVDGDGFRQETARLGQDSGEIQELHIEPANPPLMESRIEEIDGDSDTLMCWHGDEDGKGIFLNGRSVDLGPGSSLSELGFCAAREDETTPVEDETSLTFLGMTNDRVGVFDEGDAMPKDKALNLTDNDRDLERRPFGGAPSTTNNGGRREVSFNMSEFIKLAHTVIDTNDHASLTALEELKTKWEMRFGKEAAAKSFPATTTLAEPPLVRGFRQALRNAFPPNLGEKSMGNRDTVRTRILPVRTIVTGDNGGWTAAETMNGGADSESVIVPTRSTEIRPVIHGGAAIPSHGKEEKSADAIADVGADSAADVGVDYTADVGVDCDDDITAELSDDISAAGKKNCNFGTKLAPIPLFIGNIPLHANATMINNDKLLMRSINRHVKRYLSLPQRRKMGRLLFALQLIRCGKDPKDGRLRPLVILWENGHIFTT